VTHGEKELGSNKKAKRETEEEPSQILRHKHLGTSKGHISLNNGKQTTNLYPIPRIGTQAYRKQIN
jgi:hypothetical protein